VKPADIVDKIYVEAEEAMALAEAAELQGYISTYPKALIALSKYVKLLEVLLDKENEANRERLQTDGSSEGDFIIK
jgi:hypothetical protein